MTFFCAWMVMLTCVYYAFSDQRLIFVGIGLSGVVGILVGVARNRPAHSLPWYLLAAANLSFASGEFAQIVIIQYLHESLFPSVADAFYLATYVLYAAGLLGFVRWRTVRRDRASLIDALTLTVGIALLCWIYLIVPYVHSPGLSWIQKAISIAYPLGDILVLAMLLRLLAPRGGKSVSLVLLTAGTLGLLASDIAYALIQLHGTWRTGTVVELGWAVFYGAWGAAALHPSMVTLTEATEWRPDHARGMLGLLTLASLIAPTMLIVAAARGDTSNVGVIGGFSAVLFFLVLYRLAGVAETQRRAVTRERTLRGAVTALGVAADVPQVATAVQQSATSLLAASPRHDIVLVMREDDKLRLVPGAAGEHVAVSERTGDLLQAQAESGGTRLLAVHALGEELSARFQPVRSALVCPLALREAAEGAPLIGALIVAGDERDLLVLRDSLATLATQGGLAVERIALSQEVSKRNSEAYFRTLVQNASDVILILDEENRIRYASPSAGQVLGSAALAGSLLADLVPPKESRTVAQALGQMRTRDEPDRREHWQMLRTDQTAIEVEVRCSDLRGEPTVAGLVLTLRDVTEQRTLERELTHRAFHDELTGLANRVLFHERVTHALTQSQREGTMVGVLLVDVDDFKVVNDTQGHPVGDELLVALSLRLSTAVRVSDTAARLGGDEFALLVEDPMTRQDLETFADHVLGVFAEPFRLSVGPVSVNASVGIATTEDSFDSVELLTHADLALYEAKTAGKRQWRWYRPALQSGMMERHEMQESLDRFPVESFVVLYQPIVSLATEAVVGFEALVRWPHSTRGTVLPEQFITLAEESGQIVPLGAWVLGSAATEAVGWHGVTEEHRNRAAAGLPSPYVSVNVSPRQFRDHGFLEVVQQVLDRTGIAPSSLVLELTESLLLRHDDRVLAEMQALTELGVRIAIDDFGTGYSSLSYLREFPISILKIDKSFIDDLGRSNQQYALVDGITRLADTLGLTVIAEGVENSTQRELLVSMGCPLGQGYLFAKPVGAEEARELVLSQAAKATTGRIR